MTQEDKDLLLKDICARLPYNVKCCIYNFYRYECEDETITINNLSELIDTFSICEIKPYLFPMSSMTEEQKEEMDLYYRAIFYGDTIKFINQYIDWFNKNHFDYRGLIEKGLALDATGLNIY